MSHYSVSQLDMVLYYYLNSSFAYAKQRIFRHGSDGASPSHSGEELRVAVT